MKLQLKGLGAEPKKLAFLGVAVAVLGAVLYFNFFSSDETPAPRPQGAVQRIAQATEPDTGGVGVVRPPAPETRARPSIKGGGQQSVRPEFKLGLKDKELDPASIDPTLRLDKLSKVQTVALAGGARNLFEFGASPLPKNPEPKILPTPVVPVGPPPPPTPTPKPPAPPIPLKFYGYATPAPSGAKRVFFLDGEDIIVAAEGQLVKNRYKVVRIGINSVVVEDMQFQNQQTLPLQEQKEQAG